MGDEGGGDGDLWIPGASANHYNNYKNADNSTEFNKINNDVPQVYGFRKRGKKRLLATSTL